MLQVQIQLRDFKQSLTLLIATSLLRFPLRDQRVNNYGHLCCVHKSTGTKKRASRVEREGVGLTFRGQLLM